MKAIIPAAGLGTRFLPVTKAQPKEMLPVLDKPIMQYVIEEAVDSGVSEILLVTGKAKRAIEDHFDSNAELEQSLADQGKAAALDTVHAITEMAHLFSVRQSRPKGLGHAIHYGAPFVGDEPFYVLLGDIIVPDHNVLPRLLEVHEKTGASVIAVEPVAAEDVSKYGIIAGQQIEDGVWKVSDMIEKPPVGSAPSNLAITGRYLLTPRIMEILENTPPGRDGEIQLTDALIELLGEEEVYAVVIDPRDGFDTGNMIGWLETNLALGLRDERYKDQIRSLIDSL
ncbi:MAG: UTP--glucose-1-phosphate uridylyltransferase GalU [Actinomycetia bacterium]|nr:UTP--glucose-1-phosphate uridylyltransferase GalU [Actinomycetes bacterium]